MLYEMLTGQAPFVGDTINAVMYQTMNAIPPSPSTLNNELPSMLDFIVAKALAKLANVIKMSGNWPMICVPAAMPCLVYKRRKRM
jgi:hypothetical protein